MLCKHIDLLRFQSFHGLIYKGCTAPVDDEGLFSCLCLYPELKQNGKGHLFALLASTTGRSGEALICFAVHLNQGGAPTCGGEEVGLQRFWLQILYLNGFDCNALQWGEQVGLER